MHKFIVLRKKLRIFKNSYLKFSWNFKPLKTNTLISPQSHKNTKLFLKSRWLKVKRENLTK